MALLLFYLALALGVSFLCSLLEASLLSVSLGHLNALAHKGHQGARLMLTQKEAPDRPLAAILSANTVAHTIGAAGVGAQVIHIWGDKWLGVAGGLLTLCILFVTEILPKTLGTVHADRLVGFTARTVQVMIWVLYPLVAASQLVGRLVSRTRAHPRISRDEVAAVASLGMAGGSVSQAEATAIRNLLALRTVQVGDIMTPRTVVDFVPAEMTVGEFAASEREARFARLPVAEEGNIDRVVGVIHRFQILSAVRNGELATRFGDVARPVEGVPESALAAAALQTMLDEKQHMLLVVDEYGGTAGVVTLEDIMETLLGVEIVDETDPAVDMRILARELHEQRHAGRLQREVPIARRGPAT